MKSKYSANEIETILDLVEHKISKHDIIDVCPATFKEGFKKYNIFNANVILRLLNQIKMFKLQSPNAFIDFVHSIPGYHLLTDAMYDKLKSMSGNFVGTFATLGDIPNIFKNGALALVNIGPLGTPQFALRNKNNWFLLSGEQIQYSSLKYDRVIVGSEVIRPYNFAKVSVYSISDVEPNINTNIIEFNLIKGVNNWWIQIFKSTVLENQAPLIEISMEIKNTLEKYPEVIIESLNDCKVFVKLDVIN